MTVARLRFLIDRYHKALDRHHTALVLIALCLLIASASITAQLVAALPLKTHGFLDRPILALEIPRSDRELYSLAPRPSLHIWRAILHWDIPFIAGYVLLFFALWLPDPRAHTNDSLWGTGIWQSIVASAIATGLVDYLEDFAAFVCLGRIERDVKLAGSRAFTALPVLGTIKWLLFFLACRALALQYRDRGGRWYWIGAGLRALTTAGFCATVLAFFGLPGRPVIAFTATVSSVLLLAAAVTRLFPEKVAMEPIGPPASAAAVT